MFSPNLSIECSNPVHIGRRQSIVAMPATKRTLRTTQETPLVVAQKRFATPVLLASPLNGESAGSTSNNAAAALERELGVRFKVSQRLGGRKAQEDTVVGKYLATSFPLGYFGVFDGHGGSKASRYCAAHLHQHMLASTFMPHLKLSLEDAFLRADANILERFDGPERRKGWESGTAAAVMLVSASKLTLAHAGDCRAILVKRSGSTVSFIELTVDHAAEYVDSESTSAEHADTSDSMGLDERRRVEAAGGVVSGGYVSVGDHTLPMTRALGDLPLKVAANRHWREASVDEQVVTARPEVGVYERAADDLCVVMASDGLFGNVMPSAEVAACTREVLEGSHAGAAGAEKQVAECLVRRAIEEKNSSDNVSVVIVSLEPPPPPELPLETEDELAHASSSVEAMPSDKVRVGFGEAYPPMSDGHKEWTPDTPKSADDKENSIWCDQNKEDTPKRCLFGGSAIVSPPPPLARVFSSMELDCDDIEAERPLSAELC